MTWAIAALSFGLYAWRVGAKNLWLDEAVSWDMATSPVRHLVAATAADIHSPLYYLLLKAWMACAGDSAAGLRSLSVAATVVTLVLMRRLAAGVLSAGAAAAAVFWYAVSPHTVAYSQEARMYAPAAAAVIGMCVAYRRWVDSAFTRRSALIAYAGCATLAMYLHYFTTLAVAAIWLHAGVLAGTWRRRSDGVPHRPRSPWGDWVMAHAAVAVMLAPWAGTAAAQITRGQSWRQPVSWRQTPVEIAAFVRSLMFGSYGGLSPGSVACLTVLAVGLGCAVVRALRAQSDERHAFFVLLALVPPVLGLAVLPLAGSLDLSRYLCYSAPLTILSVACGLSTLRIPPACVIVLLLCGGVAPMASLQSYYESRVKDYDARPLLAYLAQVTRHEPGASPDAVLVAPGYVMHLLRVVSRADVSYEPIDRVEDLWRAASAHAYEGQAVWLIVDYRWPWFNAVAGDPRFVTQRIPLADSEKIKLLRVRVNDGDLESFDGDAHRERRGPLAIPLGDDGGQESGLGDVEAPLDRGEP